MAKEHKEPFVITEEMIANATCYLPLSDKRAFVEVMAKNCLEAYDVSLDEIAQATAIPLPQLFKEKCGQKQVYLMYHFLTEYLHIDFPNDFGDDEYDYYAGSHIFNQLERFKSKDAEIKNKVFDILYDFKELKKMLDTEIFNLKESLNDGVERISSSIGLLSTPENVKALNDLLQKTMGEVEGKQKELTEKRATAKKTTPKATEKKA